MFIFSVLKNCTIFMLPQCAIHIGLLKRLYVPLDQVADNATLYGVCLHVSEIVQRPPAILGISSPLPHSSGGLCRFLVSAPRCYCLLSKFPFFELHYEMLNR